MDNLLINKFSDPKKSARHPLRTKLFSLHATFHNTYNLVVDIKQLRECNLEIILKKADFIWHISW